MVPRKSGLIVNITSMGGLAYAINCAYGIGKAAVDRMVVGKNCFYFFKLILIVQIIYL